MPYRIVLKDERHNIEHRTSNNDVARAAQALAPRAALQIILKSNKKTNTQ